MKTCKSCKTKNGARSFSCKNCGKEFIVKKRPKKVKVTDWKILEKGQQFKVIGGSGPYFIGHNNEKQYLSEKGIYITSFTDNAGIHAFSKEGKSYAYIYMGPEEKSELCYNLYRSPHKLITLQ
jgi:hypothetical protein